MFGWFKREPKPPKIHRVDVKKATVTFTTETVGIKIATFEGTAWMSRWGSEPLVMTTKAHDHVSRYLEGCTERGVFHFNDGVMIPHCKVSYMTVEYEPYFIEVEEK